MDTAPVFICFGTKHKRKLPTTYPFDKNLINKTLQNHKRESTLMVYCPKCGTQNEDTAEYCIKCGASLQTGTYTSRRYERRKAEEQCFGLPHGGAIAGIAIGLIILIWGILLIAEQSGWISNTIDFWVVILIVIGVLMIAGAVYRMSRPRPAPPPS
jgi:hypothetical protein